MDVQANYCLGALKLVLHEMEARLADAGEEYTDEARDELRAALKEGLREAAGLTAEDYLEAQALEAELRTALEDFLMSPEANLTLLLISDIHIGNQTDTRANKLRRLFADREESGIAMDGILQAGDFGDDSSEKKSNDAFDVMAECFGNHAEWQMIGCTGNHETEYIDESENYMVSSKIYWQRMQDYVSEDGSQKYGGGVLDSVWQQELTGTDGKTYTGAPSFGLTFKDYHFVVLNSDNPGQYKNLKDLTNPTVEEALAADPIRHGAWFSKETQSWLDNQMAAYAKDGKPIFVVCHFPFIDTVPLSYFDPIPINDNSIGRQDAGGPQYSGQVRQRALLLRPPPQQHGREQRGHCGSGQRRQLHGDQPAHPELLRPWLRRHARHLVHVRLRHGDRPPGPGRSEQQVAHRI